MQNPKTRSSSMEPTLTTNVAAPRTGRKLKNPTASDSNALARTMKNRNSKMPQSSAAEIARLRDELKKAKEEAESSKKRAQHETEETKKQITEIMAKLEESQRQLAEFSETEQARLQELRKISQDRDRAWQSELEAMQKQHDLDSTALSSAMNEIQTLKNHLSESKHLRIELDEALSLVERLEAEINESRELETRAKEELCRAQMQLEVARMTEETLRDDLSKAKESSKSVALESEIAQLRAALERSEKRYEEEYIQSTLQIRGAYELAERTRSELEAELRAARAEAEALKANHTLSSSSSRECESSMAELKASLMDRETELQCMAEENESLRSKIGEITGTKKKENAEETELEEEVRRLRVQSEQWRKAAEAAAAMISGSSPVSDENEDDSPKKMKNVNMLRKIGVLLRKSQK